jgi:hypothetical protein
MVGTCLAGYKAAKTSRSRLEALFEAEEICEVRPKPLLEEFPI